MHRCLVASAVLALACSRPAEDRSERVEAPPPTASKPIEQAPPCEPKDGIAACRDACTAGSDVSCASLGVLLLQDGKHQEAERPLADACAAGVALGCGGLGSLYVVREDWKEARRYLEKGCSMGDGLACESLGGLEQGAKGAHRAADPQTALRTTRGRSTARPAIWGRPGTTRGRSSKIQSWSISS